MGGSKVRDLLPNVTIKSPQACSTSLGHLSNEIAVSSCYRGEDSRALLSFYTTLQLFVVTRHGLYVLPPCSGVLLGVGTHSGELLMLTALINSLAWSGGEQLTLLLPQGWRLTWRHSSNVCYTQSVWKWSVYTLWRIFDHPWKER